MIAVRRSEQRHESRRGKQAIWRTFSAQVAGDPLANGFGGLRLFDEMRLAPSRSVESSPRPSSEIITYVFMGALAYVDTLGRSGVLQAGEFRCATGARGVRFTETNASPRDSTHLFQIGLRSSEGRVAAEEQLRFSTADRRDALCLVAAADAPSGVLRMREDASVYSALLQSGQHVVHCLRAGRHAWLHVVSGDVALADLVLTEGDGVGITAERCVSFTAQARAEVLLLDVT
jgi:quercetin 2,3-dioxygenase